MTNEPIRLVMHNADPRSCHMLQEALRDEDLAFEYEPPMEYRGGAVQEFGTAVFHITEAGVAGAVAINLAPPLHRAGAAASEKTKAAVRRAIAKLQDKGSPAGPFEGPDDIIPKR